MTGQYCSLSVKTPVTVVLSDQCHKLLLCCEQYPSLPFFTHKKIGILCSHRFPAADGSENEVKMGGKGGKGKRRQKNISESSATGVVKEGIVFIHFPVNLCQ